MRRRNSDGLRIIEIHELFHSKATLELIELLSDKDLPEDVVADIMRIAIDIKYWEIIASTDKFNLDAFIIDDCDFTFYTLEDLKKFCLLTNFDPPYHIFNLMMMEYHDRGDDQTELIEFFGENSLNQYYQYLLDYSEDYHDVIKSLILKKEFPEKNITLDEYCFLVFNTFPEDSFFLDLALNKYGDKFYSDILDFMIENQSCQKNLYIYFLKKGGRNTIRPNLDDFKKWTNDQDFLNLLTLL